MRTPTKLAAFGAVLAVSFGGALGVGAAVADPVVVPAADHDGDHGVAAGTASERSSSAGDPQEADHDSGHGAPADAGADLPGGLAVSEHGHTLALADDTLEAGSGARLTFRVLGAGGEPVTSYQDSHDEDMHLIAVRRDMTGFQHVHPELAADGSWSVPVDLTAGSWRIFADFVPADGEMAGEVITLGADLAVAGQYDPQPLPVPAATAQVDGYTVTLGGDLVPGQESQLTLSVSRDGQPVTDLQPYLAAYGHLVALREGDLAYLHVHPAGEPGDGTTQPGPGITFYATAPSAGDYRLFLDFKHDGVVRTAEFTATAEPTPAAPTGDTDADAGPTSQPRSQPTGEPVDEHGGDGHAH